MAVTKIHRTSKMTLIIGVIVSIAVMAMFYLGGQVPAQEKLVADMSQPKFTDIVLYWAYALSSWACCASGVPAARPSSLPSKVTERS